MSINKALSISIVHDIQTNCRQLTWIHLEKQIDKDYEVTKSILTDLLLLVQGTNIHQLESHSSPFFGIQMISRYKCYQFKIIFSSLPFV